MSLHAFDSRKPLIDSALRMLEVLNASPAQVEAFRQRLERSSELGITVHHCAQIADAAHRAIERDHETGEWKLRTERLASPMTIEELRFIGGEIAAAVAAFDSQITAIRKRLPARDPLLEAIGSSTWAAIAVSFHLSKKDETK